MSEQSKAPWTDEEVAHLQAWQKSIHVHPFTCGNRDTPVHNQIDPEDDYGVLVPTKDGWVCRHCDYTQDWAHDFMLLFNEDAYRREMYP